MRKVPYATASTTEIAHWCTAASGRAPHVRAARARARSTKNAAPRRAVRAALHRTRFSVCRRPRPRVEQAWPTAFTWRITGAYRGDYAGATAGSPRTAAHPGAQEKTWSTVD